MNSKSAVRARIFSYLFSKVFSSFDGLKVCRRRNSFLVGFVALSRLRKLLIWYLSVYQVSHLSLKVSFRKWPKLTVFENAIAAHNSYDVKLYACKIEQSESEPALLYDNSTITEQVNKN